MNSTTADYLEQATNQALGHIPGEYGWPLLGKAIPFALNPIAVCEHHYLKYGAISRFKMGPDRVLLALGPENAQALHLDPDKNFSSAKGLERFQPLIGGSLIMKDFEEHRVQRRLMQTAFKNTAMREYAAGINTVCERNIRSMAAQGEFRFFERSKETLLQIAAETFTGVNHDAPEVAMLTRSFIDFVSAFDFLFAVDLPGFKFHKGMRAKNEIASFIRSMIADKRASSDRDILAHFCRERDDQGNYFSDRDVAENFVLLLFAAQDTTTASLVNTFYEIGRHPQWQHRLREESQALGKEQIEWEDLDKLPTYTLVFNEVQRLHSSVPLFPRRSIRPCELSGVEIPANTMLINAITYNHRMPQWWQQPELFDPERFARGEHKQHPFLFHPFGGGAHKCIGMHFAQYVYKSFLHQVLMQYEIVLRPDYSPKWQYLPMPKPVDNLPVSLRRLR